MSLTKKPKLEPENPTVLPIDILVRLFCGFTSPSDFFSIGLSCKFFYNLVAENVTKILKPKVILDGSITPLLLDLSNGLDCVMILNNRDSKLLFDTMLACMPFSVVYTVGDDGVHRIKPIDPTQSTLTDIELFGIRSLVKRQVVFRFEAEQLVKAFKGKFKSRYILYGKNGLSMVDVGDGYSETKEIPQSFEDRDDDLDFSNADPPRERSFLMDKPLIGNIVKFGKLEDTIDMSLSDGKMKLTLNKPPDRNQPYCRKSTILATDPASKLELQLKVPSYVFHSAATLAKSLSMELWFYYFEKEHILRLKLRDDRINFVNHYAFSPVIEEDQ